MIKKYREIFQIPGSLAFSSAAFIGRLPMSMAGLGIITMISQLHGGYALAGTVAAVFSFAMAVLGPQVSRMVDNYGQGKVLPIAAFISAAAMLALLILARMGAPTWALFMSAIFAGCMPSMSAMVRARWTPLLPDKEQLQTAYALESVLDEVSFIVGPPISIGFSIAFFPEAGLLAALVFQLVGIGIFVVQIQTEPSIQGRISSNGKSPLTIAGVQILLLLLFAMGVIVGTTDVVSVAFASNQGTPAAASIVLSVYAIGSCISGLIFGSLRLNLSLSKLLMICGIATAISTVPLVFVNSIFTLSLVIFFGGLFFAPTMIVAMSLVETIVSSEKITEGFTWLISGLGAGMAVGAGVSGAVVDWFGIPAGFGVALSAGFIGMIVVTFGQKKLSSSNARDW